MTNAEIAKKLTERERDFLFRVCDGRMLAPADRVEDRARQKLRRMGLVRVAKNPRRWVATADGLAIRTILETSHD